MKVLRNLIYREICLAVIYVSLAFLALFFFFDLVDEMRWVGNSGYTAGIALLFVALAVPGHLYELMPIAVLIGTIFVMARFAQSSEFTIMRTSGMGPWLALRTLLALGIAFVALTVVVGDYITPAADNYSQKLRILGKGQISSGATGAWLKEKQGEHSIAINVGAIKAPGDFVNVRIFEFDGNGHITGQIRAQAAQVDEKNDQWLLQGAEFTKISQDGEKTRITKKSEAQMQWPTQVTAAMVSGALLKPDRMTTIALFQFIRHLEANGQAAQKYEIEFWRKVFYPLSCLVMVVLALPFAYLHFRSGGITAYVFGGVMAGISFFLLNNVFGYIGTLQSWWPWLAAAAPGLLYTALSLSAFGWLVLRR
ncbi:MAG: LPS export ABC transporter permease LptG [Comamonas sp.]|jgi:lipopolysaccharide export system permease protein|uniref:LPS export ABC transporter permease LptG n=1 Tax=Comamonas sp. TaxID=34028 RepID=UPI00281FFE35|nr:LPS export ABC transporter permease LptG [Comamonas sp.]MDR0215217.1 LPS export ABC transporter permease LptG [Comamonas sp.]